MTTAAPKSPITTHVLDVSRGKPASGMGVRLELKAATGEWTELGRAETDADGRASGLLTPGARLMRGVYRLSFETGEYFAEREGKTFYPTVDIAFDVSDPAEHYHVPLLLSPYGYSTYRGS